MPNVENCAYCACLCFVVSRLEARASRRGLSDLSQTCLGLVILTRGPRGRCQGRDLRPVDHDHPHGPCLVHSWMLCSFTFSFTRQVKESEASARARGQKRLSGRTARMSSPLQEAAQAAPPSVLGSCKARSCTEYHRRVTNIINIPCLRHHRRWMLAIRAIPVRASLALVVVSRRARHRKNTRRSWRPLHAS